MNKYMRLIPALMLGLATLSIPTLATAQTTVDIVGASLLARGAAVLVTVVVTCDEPFPLDSVINHIDMDISQRAGRFITGGEGGAEGDEPITCDGTSQTFNTTLITQS